MIKVFDDGSIMTSPYLHYPFIKGNNYIKRINFLNKKNYIAFSYSHQIDNEQAIYLGLDKKVYRFKEDVITDSFNRLGNSVPNIFFNNVLYFFYIDAQNNQISIAVKQGNALKYFGQVPFKLTDRLSEYCFFILNNQVCFGNLNRYCYVTANGYGQVITRKLATPYYNIIVNAHSSKFIYAINKTNDTIVRFKQLDIDAKPEIFLTNIFLYPMAYDSIIINNKSINKQFVKLNNDTATSILQLKYDDGCNQIVKASQGSYYINSANKTLRTFEYIKRYPTLFNNSSASMIWSLAQSNTGTIYAGSYNQTLATITPLKSTVTNFKILKPTNGSCFCTTNCILLAKELKVV